MSESDTELKEMVARLRRPTTSEEQLEAYAYLAGNYDKTFSHAVSHEVAVDRLLRRLGGLSAPRILDAGCGTGLAAAYARRRRDGLHLIGVDYSKEMLAVADAKRVFDATALADLSQPFALPDGPFDGVVLISVLVDNHLGPEILPHVMAHLRAGGYAVCSVRPDSLAQRRDEYERMVKEAGCEIVAEEEGAYSKDTEVAIYLELKKIA